tara:strand:+ start:238 stop:492 length:255 start_codon:yes stop_codon:yes gene_type:complete
MTFNEDETTVEPVICVSPVILTVPVWSKGPTPVKEPDKVVEPETTSESVPKVPTLEFSTKTPKEPLAMRLVALGFIPVYFILFY